MMVAFHWKWNSLRSAFFQSNKISLIVRIKPPREFDDRKILSLLLMFRSGSHSAVFLQKMLYGLNDVARTCFFYYVKFEKSQHLSFYTFVGVDEDDMVMCVLWAIRQFLSRTCLL